MSRAAVYVPLGIPDDGRYTLEAVDLIQHRGYEYAGTYRQAHYVDKLLREGIVQVVVLARDRHWDPECGWPVEFVPATSLSQASRNHNGCIWVSSVAIGPKPRRETVSDDPTVALLDMRRRSRAERVLDERIGRWVNADKTWRKGIKPR